MVRLSTLAAVLAAGAALGACGSGSSAELLSGATASEIRSNLGEVRRLAAEGDCIGAQDAALEVSDEIDALGRVDKRLKAALREGASRLNEVLANCEEVEAEEEEEEAPTGGIEAGAEGEEEGEGENAGEGGSAPTQKKAGGHAKQPQGEGGREAGGGKAVGPPRGGEAEPPAAEEPEGEGAGTPQGGEGGEPSGGVSPGTAVEGE